MSNNPFDKVSKISSCEDYIRASDDPNEEKDYPAFFVNRSMSNFLDTILYANLMNQAYDLPSIMQQDFYINSIRKRKRFSKWAKPMDNEKIKLIMHHYRVSKKVAKDYEKLVSDDDMREMEELYYKGG